MQVGKMMRVGVISCYFNHNYGSMLQAYATQRIIEKLGYEAVTFQCSAPIRYMTQSKGRYYFHKLTNKDIVKTKIRQFKGKIVLKRQPNLLKELDIRNSCFDAFYKKYIHLSPLNQNRAQLSKLAGTMDAVVVGSDMLWHPVNIEHDYYTLTFVPDAVKKISYATSFGTTVIPKYQKQQAKAFLKRFDSVSVRESSGVKVIKNLGVDKKVQVVLDPTLLFTAAEWMDIQREDSVIKGKYIFCYFLGVNQAHRRMAEEIKKATGYKIVTLQHLDEYVKEDENFGDIRPYNIGPEEFVNLIHHAEYVCTDSFHGTCFSILNHKKFLTFNRFLNTNSQSTNTRIDSLLGMLDLSERRVAETLDREKIMRKLDSEINYSQVDQKLSAVREESIRFLKDALA
jgi:hypothetical protein